MPIVKNVFITILRGLFYPVRCLITYKPKSCFWGHKWGKWTQSNRIMQRIHFDGRPTIDYNEIYQYCKCSRCNKYKEEIL